MIRAGNLAVCSTRAGTSHWGEGLSPSRGLLGASFNHFGTVFSASWGGGGIGSTNQFNTFEMISQERTSS